MTAWGDACVRCGYVHQNPVIETFDEPHDPEGPEGCYVIMEAKIRAERDERIRRCGWLGWPKTDIARAEGVSRMTVHRVLTDRTDL